MDSGDLVMIATYLQLVVKHTDGAKLTWLFGKDQVSGMEIHGGHEETQCLSFGGALWIASNDDFDSKAQLQFLAYIGIAKPSKLLDHVKTYGRRVLQRNGTTLAAKQMDKHSILSQLLPPPLDSKHPLK
ncbi:MAG TPA: hypothetical protein VEU30_05115, partial [Thermoanaerobaculia bacterium]|nr:hypothetical protein [Thermoanaerobaculia bacterium]